MVSAISAFRVSMTRISPFRDIRFSYPASSALAHTKRILCNSSHSVSSSPSPSDTSSSSSSSLMETSENARWRPMCLYYTHGKCTKMDDPAHLEIFNHDCSRELQVAATDLERKKSQEFNFFLVIDLEGKVEILEFPVLIVDAKTMEVVDLFHRFVRPTKMTEQAINKYIEGKYGELGVDRVWHDTAIPFNQVVEEFEAWLAEHGLWAKDTNGALNNAAFVTW